MIEEPTNELRLQHCWKPRGDIAPGAEERGLNWQQKWMINGRPVWRDVEIVDERGIPDTFKVGDGVICLDIPDDAITVGDVLEHALGKSCDICGEPHRTIRPGKTEPTCECIWEDI